MRSFALAESFLLASFLTVAMPACADIQECGSPQQPRGMIVCEGDQLALCEVTVNRVNGQCMNKGGRTGRQLEALILSIAYGRQISGDQVEQQEEYRRSLREGLVRRSDGAVVTFSYRGANESPSKPAQPSEPAEGSRSFTCTACVAINAQDVCEARTAVSEDDAKRAAIEGLEKRFEALLGSTIDAPLEGSTVECKEQ